MNRPDLKKAKNAFIVVDQKSENPVSLFIWVVEIFEVPHSAIPFLIHASNTHQEAQIQGKPCPIFELALILRKKNTNQNQRSQNS